MSIGVLYAKVPNEDQRRVSLVHTGNILQALCSAILDVIIGGCVPFPTDAEFDCIGVSSPMYMYMYCLFHQNQKCLLENL